jgi:septum formation protein
MTRARPPLTLASTSRYRRELLARLGLSFEVAAPRVEEARLPDEAPEALARRLAAAKAAAVAGQRPGHVVIGSDQVAALGDRVLCKPGTPERAIEQLRAASGRSVHFLTAVAVQHPDGRQELHVDHTRVDFRVLTDAQIERYVALDAPLDCAGSFRSEGLGVRLFERLETEDPAALVGLPLVWLAGALARAGLDPLSD